MSTHCGHGVRPDGPRAGQALAAPALRIGAASLLVLAALALGTGIAGGLSRVGFAIPLYAAQAWVPAATVFHAALMIGGLSEPSSASSER